MVKIVKPRGTGKTKEIIYSAARTRGTIVCADPEAMRQKMIGYEVVGPNVISYREYLLNNSADIDKSTKYYIDEIEGLLEILSKQCGNIAAYSETYPDNE